MTNCSYTDSNGTLISLQCVNYCCIGRDVNYCSASTCSSTTSTEDNLPVLFWGILGGIFAIGLILITVTYIICRFRSPNSCTKSYSDDEMFDEESMTSQRRRSSLFVTKYLRRESIWRLKTRRKSQLTVKVHGNHASTSKADVHSEHLTKKNHVKNGRLHLSSGGGGNKNLSSALPEVVD
ncbi:uncharacterized protein LOC133203757 [Saccostrea echinata]|uniref:uncharacterized protein LOC133203757 n=1 Tax=Saccostrea echinata TaxID=191078 RepID=UPI002A82C6CB|nr:uncharacterized protein LOC133203757 [Saccostrea echinata]